jgi:hypothetical protein
MPKRGRTSAAGMGLGPILIILFLLVASLYSVFLGRTLVQLGARVAIVAVIVGIMYLAWYELAKRNPQFRMGAAGESTIILVVVAVSLIFISDPLASSVGLAVIPNFSSLQMIGGPSLDLASSQIASLSIILGLIVLGLLMVAASRKSK